MPGMKPKLLDYGRPKPKLFLRPIVVQPAIIVAILLSVFLIVAMWLLSGPLRF